MRLPAPLSIAGAATAYFLLARPRQLRWGATDEEANGLLVGDDLISHPDLTATRGITVHASPGRVWPWIAQLGQGRGGFYSYDFLENIVGCDIHSADRVVPEWQQVEVGDEVKIHPEVALTVAVLDPGRSLVLHGGIPMGNTPSPFDHTWAFVLTEGDGAGTTRLLARERYAYIRSWASLIVEPTVVVSFVMSQKMLRGIRDRAEAAVDQAPGSVGDRAARRSRRCCPGWLINEGDDEMPTTPLSRGDRARVDLYWLPLGAGDASHCVRWNGRLFEWLMARSEHREVRDLYHSALCVHLGTDRFVVEMAPAWDSKQADRGVVSDGSVGLPWLGHSRFFRYEVRRSRNGKIPDVSEAVASPQRLSSDVGRAQRLLDLVPAFPTVTWGRDEFRTGDMWNSNSLVAWLLARSGHETSLLEPPHGGRAPGWMAGLVVAARQAEASRGVATL